MTATVVDRIAHGLAAPYSGRPDRDVYGVLAELGARRFANALVPEAAAFDPSKLATLRLWYDTNDLSTLFQDSAGTIPVTASGQNVRRINDKSGNGCDVTFDSSVVLGQDSDGVYYLQGNGSSVGTSVITANLSSSDKLTMFCASQGEGTTGYKSVISFGDILSNSGSFEIAVKNGTQPKLYWRGSSDWCGKTADDAQLEKIVHASQIDFSGASIAAETPLLNINGKAAAITTEHTDSGASNFGNLTVKIFDGVEQTYAGKFYGFFAISGLLDSQTVADCEAWLGKHCVIPIYGPTLDTKITPTEFTDSIALVDKTDYLQTSAGAQFIVDTSATLFEVSFWSNIYNSYSFLAAIGVYVDGTFIKSIQATENGANTIRVALAEGSKRVSFVNGPQSRPATIIGSFVVSVSANAAMTEVTPSVTNRLYIYGESIATGGNCNDPQKNAWPMQLRRYRGYDSTLVDAFGFRSLYDDAVDSTARSAFVSIISDASPAILWIAIGTNDYGLSKQSASDFGSDYAALLDALHTAMPYLSIYCQTPTVRTSEAANSYGDTLGNYRTQISTAVSTRASYCTLVDGTALVSTGDLDDAVHPTDAGHSIMYLAIKTALGI